MLFIKARRILPDSFGEGESAAIESRTEEMVMVNPELLHLREKQELLQSKLELLSERVSRTEGRVTDATKQTIWQFVIFMVGVASLIIGLVNYQNSVLEKRFDQIDKRLEQMQKDTNSRLDRVERNLDELNKELRNRPK
jgi:predicted  nucleic acid-binding Zn-ribbon protein